MIGGRIWGFKGKPWSRKSPSATMRYTSKTTNDWLKSLDNKQNANIQVGPLIANPILGCLAAIVYLAIASITLSVLIWFITLF